MLTLRFVGLGIVLAFALLGCAPRYSIVRADPTVATPRGTRFFVAAASYSGAAILGRDYESWLEPGDASSEHWSSAERAFGRRFAQRLEEAADGRFAFERVRAQLPADALGIAVRITAIERVRACGFVSGEVALVRRDGTVVDTIVIRARVQGPFTNVTTLEHGADRFAERVVAYLRARSGG